MNASVLIQVPQAHLDSFKRQSKQVAKQIAELTNQPRIPHRKFLDLMARACGYTSFAHVTTLAPGYEPKSDWGMFRLAGHETPILVKGLVELIEPLNEREALIAIGAIPKNHHASVHLAPQVIRSGKVRPACTLASWTIRDSGSLSLSLKGGRAPDSPVIVSPETALSLAEVRMQGVSGRQIAPPSSKTLDSLTKLDALEMFKGAPIIPQQLTPAGEAIVFNTILLLDHVTGQIGASRQVCAEQCEHGKIMLNRQRENWPEKSIVE